MDKLKDGKSVSDRTKYRDRQRTIDSLGLDYLSIYPVPDLIEGKAIKLDAVSEDGKLIKVLGISFGYYTVVTNRLYDDITSKDINEPTRKLINYIQRYLGCAESSNTNVIRLTTENIMNECSISKPSVYKAIDSLLNFRLLFKTQIKGKYVVNHKYIYRFSPLKFSTIQSEYRDRYDIRIEDNTIIVDKKK